MGLLNCRPTRIKQSQYLEEKYGLDIKSIDDLNESNFKNFIVRIRNYYYLPLENKILYYSKGEYYTDYEKKYQHWEENFKTVSIYSKPIKNIKLEYLYNHYFNMDIHSLYNHIITTNYDFVFNNLIKIDNKLDIQNQIILSKHIIKSLSKDLVLEKEFVTWNIHCDRMLKLIGTSPKINLDKRINSKSYLNILTITELVIYKIYFQSYLNYKTIFSNLIHCCVENLYFTDTNKYQWRLINDEKYIYFGWVNKHKESDFIKYYTKSKTYPHINCSILNKINDDDSYIKFIGIQSIINYNMDNRKKYLFNINKYLMKQTNLLFSLIIFIGVNDNLLSSYEFQREVNHLYYTILKKTSNLHTMFELYNDIIKFNTFVKFKETELYNETIYFDIVRNDYNIFIQKILNNQLESNNNFFYRNIRCFYQRENEVLDYYNLIEFENNILFIDNHKIQKLLKEKYSLLPKSLKIELSHYYYQLYNNLREKIEVGISQSRHRSIPSPLNSASIGLESSSYYNNMDRKELQREQRLSDLTRFERSLPSNTLYGIN